MVSDNAFMCTLGAVIVTALIAIVLILRVCDAHDEKMAELGYQQVVENGVTLWKKVP